MSNRLNDKITERRNARTAEIDRLSTGDMLAVIHQEDMQIASAIAPCLPDIARLVDNAAAAVSRGGRLVLVGAGASGRQGMLAAAEYAPGAGGPVVALLAGGPEAMLNTSAEAAMDYERGARDLEAIGFNPHDMLVGLTVSGRTPWVWGALRHAWAMSAPAAVISATHQSEAAQLADIVVVPEAGPEVVAGFGNPKALIAQKLVLNMVTTGLAVRSGRVYGNLRVDLEPAGDRCSERQIAIVMEAADCSRAAAKTALAACNNHCKTAILMVLTGLDAWRAHDLLNRNHGYLRLAAGDVPLAG
ncbi:N-acetylmuramic acid 6-phosphate etherase [Enterobacteriaceae bacterium BIT-l23]|uniref:N-acetylmuramic acid 6-phosphate etherase n=1 Tax=Jejubacter sp. L23 TaxID=3092086 RepID=UPI001585A7B7|nr:N-acetylmuramic acid 6-phosphate etherase [Enterobacteriaceae bacterium BIT-l23]